jgi:glycerol kinase
MPSCVLTIDQGTTGTTVLVLDHEGRSVGRAYSEFKQIYPRPGWVEHDPEEIWEVTCSVIDKALRDAGIAADRIAAIGITNQRETTVVWDRTSGKPLHNAIVWQCRRTAPICQDLRNQGRENWFRERTGLVLDAYFSGTKIVWLLDNVPDARKRAEQGELLFGTIDTWLIWKLSGGTAHVTDYTNASRTLVYNIYEREWDQDILALLRIPRDVLPEVKPSSGVCAHTVSTGPLGAEIPIAGIAGDQQAALFGQGGWEPGMVKNTYGTGSFLLMYTGDKAVRSTQGLLTTLACSAAGGPAYALEGAIFTTGAAVQWLRDELEFLESASDSENMARSVSDNHGVYMVPAFVGLGAPYWDMEARGAIVGLTRGSNRAHIVRATLESIAYQTRDVVEVMTDDSGIPIKELRVDGGASANDFLMQFQADILRVRVDRPAMVETTALGAAFLAGMGVDFWKGTDELGQARRGEKVFEPSMSGEEGEVLYKGWKEAVNRVRSRPAEYSRS